MGNVQFINVIYRHSEQQQLFLLFLALSLSLSISPSICCIYQPICLSPPLALPISAFICNGIAVCVRTHGDTHRDYVVTGDTIGTLDEVMHLSVFLIPCFKSLFTPCSLSPHTGTKTHRCSLSRALCTLAHIITHTHTEAWMHLEVTKVANAPSWLYVCVSQQV